MSWTKSELFQLWTALAITISAIVTGLVYLIARRQAKFVAPSVIVQLGGRHDNLTSFTCSEFPNTPLIAIAPSASFLRNEAREPISQADINHRGAICKNDEGDEHVVYHIGIGDVADVS